MTQIKNTCFWYTQKDYESTNFLDHDLDVDVVIVGGGMAGLTAVQSFQKQGKSVVLLEKDFCGAGASGKTSGFITPDSEITLGDLISIYGPEKSKRLWDFVNHGVEIIRKNIEDFSIECDYGVQDSLYIANNNFGYKSVIREHEARRKLGFESNLYDQDKVSSIIGSPSYVGGVRFPKTFGINSFLYCQAMKAIFLSEGAQVYENTQVIKIDKNGVQTPKAFIKAKYIIVCIDRFIPELHALKKEIYHVQTFLGISKPLSHETVQMIFPEKKMMVWDTNLVYNYFRVTGENRLLLGGGDVLYTYARNETMSLDRFARRLSNYFQKKFPQIKFELEYLWPGMLGVSKDLLAIMGPDSRSSNVFYIGAATGLPWAAALGEYISEKINDGRSDLDQDFSPNRKFLIGPRLQSALTTPLTYALSHGIISI